MADLPALMPTALDNHTVALWVIGSLVGLMLFLGPLVYGLIYRLIMAHKKRLDDEAVKCEAERVQLAARLELLMVRDRDETRRLAERASEALENTAVANQRLVVSVDNNSHVVDRLTRHLDESGEHKTQGSRANRTPRPA